MNTVLYTIDAIAIALFFLGYYFGCYRKGYKIDIWYSFLFMSCVLSCQIMLPFAGSDLNAISIGALVTAAQEHIADAFIISFVGYLAILAGAKLWKLRLGIGIRRTTSAVLDILPHQSRLLMSSRRLLNLQASLCLLCEGAIILAYFRASGFGFDLRKYAFEEPAIRPIALAISNYTIVIASHSFARYLDTKEKSLLVGTISLAIGLLFFGARSSILAVFFTVTLVYFIRLRRRLKLRKVILFFVVLLFTLLYVGALRAGITSMGLFVSGVIIEIFYGNTFSDLRDFSLILSSWDGHFWLGKTYIAAAFAFVPRFLSDYRDKWSLGVVTASMVGFDPKVHPGLRPGCFGESYLNFGYMGVLVMGLVAGIVLRMVDSKVKEAVGAPHPSISKAFSYTVLLNVLSDILISAGASSIYMLLLVYAVSAFLRKVIAGYDTLFGRQPNLKRAPEHG